MRTQQGATAECVCPLVLEACGSKRVELDIGEGVLAHGSGKSLVAGRLTGRSALCGAALVEASEAVAWRDRTSQAEQLQSSK